MIINVDKEGRNAIQQLVDIALKQGGIQNLNPANLILGSIKLLPEVKEKPYPKSPKEDSKKVVETADEEPKKEKKSKKVEKKKVEQKNPYNVKNELLGKNER